MCHWRKGSTFRVLPFGMLVPGFGSGQLGDLCRITGAMAHPNARCLIDFSMVAILQLIDSADWSVLIISKDGTRDSLKLHF